MILIIPGNMKKICSILGVISLFAACTAELDTTPEITEEQTPIIEKAPVLYASIEEGAETKVYLDENYKVLWHADDRISVFNKDTYKKKYSAMDKQIKQFTKEMQKLISDNSSLQNQL